MAEVGQVDSDLVLAAGVRIHIQQREWLSVRSNEAAFDRVARPGGRAVRPRAVLDRTRLCSSFPNAPSIVPSDSRT